MANICVFTQTLLAGGAEKDAALLANSLIESHNVYLLIYYGERIDNRLFNILNPENVHIVKLHGNTFSKMLQMCSFFKKSKIDIIFSMLLLPNFFGGILGRICGVQFPVGGIKSAQLDKSKVLINRFLQNHVNKLTVYNNYKGFEFYSEKGFNSDRAVVIPNSLENIPRPIVREKKGKVNIISVGRFHVAKDYLTALKAINQLRNEEVEIKYFLIGYGDLENNIKKWVSELKLEGRVQIIINPENISEYFINADIFLLSSIFEGLPNAVLEAFSYSLPVVSTRVGDIERVVKNGKTGFVCEPKDYKALSKQLRLLIDDYNMRLEFGKAGYEIVKKDYSASVSKSRYLELIDSLLEN